MMLEPGGKADGVAAAELSGGQDATGSGGRANVSPDGWQAVGGSTELAALVARQADALAADGGVGARLAADRDALLPVLDGHLEGILEAGGMQVRERRARLDLVPSVIAQAVQDAAPFGVDPGHNGVGLSGGAGIGKTMAVAALVRRYGSERLRHGIAERGRDALRDNRWLAWLSWPDQVHRMRTRSMADGGHADVASWVDRWGGVPVLVLDDIGVERVVGATYADDWATSNLDRVLDARERAALPTWYTTNLDQQALVGRYGARMFSRLAGTNRNPLVVLTGRHGDMRMARRG